MLMMEVPLTRDKMIKLVKNLFNNKIRFQVANTLKGFMINTLG
jgi:hypothetical protein